MTSYTRKLFYRIQEVADIVGVEPYVLRYWESRFPMLRPEKDAGDQRRYRDRDIEVLMRIRELLYDDKYTVSGAVEQLQAELAKGGRHRTPPAPEADEAAASPEKLAALKEELGILRRELEAWREELG
ncbi:MAG: MerR family transcriptional regulator [Candidatus Sumerlaeia bacterium]|nr:MerR family transcriptional regulator [Candidatus Sumerlaeia bacterium]